MYCIIAGEIKKRKKATRKATIYPVIESNEGQTPIQSSLRKQGKGKWQLESYDNSVEGRGETVLGLGAV